MAESKKPATTSADDQSKAAQEREAYFYANHRPPSGYEAQMVNGKLDIRPVKKG